MELTNEEKSEMKEFIDDELYEINGDGEYCEHDCLDCIDLERCYTKAIQKMNHEFAESINFGGYDTEEEFWEQI